MAPRPRTYWARRSYAKPAGDLVNGNTTEDAEQKFLKVDVTSMRTRKGKEKDLGTAPIEETQDILSQCSGKEDESAPGTVVVEAAAPSRTPDIEENSTTVLPVARSLRKRKMSAQDIPTPDTSLEEHGSRRKRIRRSFDGSATPEKKSLIFKARVRFIPIDRTAPSSAKAASRGNGFIENYQQSPVDRDVYLKDIPSDLNNLAIWVTQLIRKSHQDENLFPPISEPGKNNSSPLPGHDIETGDASVNVGDVRMTRGNERKILQRLKGKEPGNDKDLSSKCVTEEGKALRLKDPALVEKLLKDQLNDNLKQTLFGSSNSTEVSTHVTERNACGKLLFNTVVDIGESADHVCASVLKSALEQRKEDGPFVSALRVLASSSEIIAFINFIFSKDNAPQWETSNGDESRPSTGAESSGATTITETSGLTSRVGTSISIAEDFSKATNWKKVINNKKPDMSPIRSRSQEIIHALDTATTVLLQILQGEAGPGYVTPYANGSMVSNPVGQHHLAHYGPPVPNHPAYGMAFGPPVGAHVNTYASPYAVPLATHSDSYASPYSNPLHQAPATYASPYVNAMVPNQARGFVPTGGNNNQTNNHHGRETHRDTQVSRSHVIDTKVKKGNDVAASRQPSNKEQKAKKPSGEDGQSNSRRKHETRKVYEEATRQGTSNAMQAADNAVDLDGTDADDTYIQERGGEDDQTSSSDSLTADGSPAPMPDDRNVTPPAEDHKLFTGERLGNFTSVEDIDWLLTMSNGGKMPKPSKKRRTRSPSRDLSSQVDTAVQNEVSKIINEIMQYKDWRGYPGATMRQLFYASAEGQRLAAELRRLMAIAQPVVNTIIPLAESEARLRFYQQLASRARKERRDRDVYQGMNRVYAAPLQIQQWAPPPPIGLPTGGFALPPPVPSNGPVGVPFIRRGNVIAAPPGGRNVEEEMKAETYGYPPMPGSRPGESSPGQQRKSDGRR